MEDFLIQKVEEISFTKVDLQSSLWQSGVLDSITIIEFAVEVENEYGIKIPFDEVIEENFETLERLIAYIERKKSGNA